MSETSEIYYKKDSIILNNDLVYYVIPSLYADSFIFNGFKFIFQYIIFRLILSFYLHSYRSFQLNLLKAIEFHNISV